MNREVNQKSNSLQAIKDTFEGLYNGLTDSVISSFAICKALPKRYSRKPLAVKFKDMRSVACTGWLLGLNREQTNNCFNSNIKAREWNTKEYSRLADYLVQKYSLKSINLMYDFLSHVLFLIREQNNFSVLKDLNFNI